MLRGHPGEGQTQQLGPTVAHDGAEFIIYPQVASVQSHVRDAHGRLLKGPAKARLAVLQRNLRLLSFRNVDMHHHCAERPGDREGRHPQQKPALLRGSMTVIFH